MILAALYNDKTSFDRLSAPVQAGIKSGSTRLFPWYWTQKSGASTEYSYADLNSASDADINIALAYMYAHDGDCLWLE
jgi:endo-1,4-beta-D-glucanase Y